jgi:hypothetical protein
MRERIYSVQGQLDPNMITMAIHRTNKKTPNGAYIAELKSIIDAETALSQTNIQERQEETNRTRQDANLAGYSGWRKNKDGISTYYHNGIQQSKP